jgi:arylsulfatase A-like enzyme
MVKLCQFLLLVLLVSCKNHNKEEAFGKTTIPNIIIINIDDLGWKDSGFMGSDYYQTPNIDALSKLGMVFTNGYAAAANCAPSRASLMTGKWTPRHGIYTVNSSERGKSKDRKLIPVKNTNTLALEHQTIANKLKANGYITCHSGKWHLSKDPKDFGFNINIAGGHNGHPSSYYPPYKNVNISSKRKKYLTDVIMEKTVAFIDSVKQPFFLNYAPYAVHTPIQPIDSLLGKYKNKKSATKPINAGYATMVENLDRNIGLLISSLKKRNLFKKTLIVFTSDNGGLYGITNQHPLRAGKGSYYEGGIREPFFFVWDGVIQANSQNNTPITHLDIFPTLLHGANINYVDKDFDGKSLLPLLKGEEVATNRQLYWHFPIYLQAYTKDNQNRDPLFRTRPGSVIRLNNWKLHYYFEDNGVELYNLDNDIGESKNLAEENPEKINELLQLLKKWWKRVEAPIPSKPNSEYVSLNKK